MTFARAILLLAFILVIGIPFVLRPPGASDPHLDQGRALIVLTPHVQQIQREFEHAFAAWHQNNYGLPARIDWRTPGGTSEIRKLLKAKFEAVIEQGRYTYENDVITLPRGAVEFDVMFGGGSYDHGELKRGNGVSFKLRTRSQARRVIVPNSVPPAPPFTEAQLDEWFGQNKIGDSNLYDPDQYWFGTALSSFGIVYNRDVLNRLGLPEPMSFDDMTDPRLAGWIALADPRQSGSAATTYNSILDNEGWDGGWRILREMSANARYFTGSATKPPIDVSQGDAAMGVAIDFYGRSQAQSVMRPGETPATARVGFTDPAGAVFIDPDPVSIIRGCPHPELARRFVEFCMSEEAQALWQYRAGEKSESGLGPVEHELRRLPARRKMYEPGRFEHFVDRVNPFEIASDVPSRGWRDALAPVMTAFAIDNLDEIHAAWAALNKARENPAVPPGVLAEMEALFYAMPELELPGGEVLLLSPENFKAIASAWKDHRTFAPRSQIAMARFFRKNYERVTDLAAPYR